MFCNIDVALFNLPSNSPTTYYTTYYTTYHSHNI